MASQALQQLAQIIAAIDNTYELPSINTLKLAVQVLDEVFDDQPKVVVQHIDQIIAVLGKMAAQPDLSWLLDRAHLLDFVVSVVQTFPKIVTGKNSGVKDRATTILKISFELMAQVSSETTDEWMNPADGFKVDEQEDVNHDAEKQVQTSIVLLVEAVGFKTVLLHMQPLFLEYIQNTTDWRYQYSALVVASQLGAGGCKLQALGLVVQWAMSMTQHYHPKVRYAALDLLGEFSTDLSPQFQETYFDSLVPLTSKMLHDAVPRVVAHTFACMTNFFEECKELWKIENCLGEFLGPIVQGIKTGSTLMKESALSTLCSFATTEDAFGPNLPSIFELGYEIVASCGGQAIYRQMLNQSFQLLSMLFASQKKQLVVQYLPQFVTLLFSNKDNIDDDYFLKAWGRICLIQEPFTDLTHLYDSLLGAVRNMFNNYESDDECAEALTCLITTFKTFRNKAGAFVADTLTFAKEKFESKENSIVIREHAMSLVVRVFAETRPDDPEQLTKWYHDTCAIYNYIAKNIEQQLDDEEGAEFQELPEMFEGLKDLAKSLGSCLTGTHLVSMAEKQISFVRKIEQLHASFQGLQQLKEGTEEQEMDSAQQAVGLAKNVLDNLEEAMDAVPDILEELLKLSVEPTTKEKLVSMVRSEIQAAVEKRPFMLLLGVGLAVSVLESGEGTAVIPELLKLFMHFAGHPLPRVRNGCVYGMSLAVRRVSPAELSQEKVSQILGCLSLAYLTPFETREDSKDDEYFAKHCKDNVISALGNLLKCFGGVYGSVLNQQIYSYWLSNLPLNTDKIEGNEQQQLLISMLRECPSLLIRQAKDLKLVCQIYAKFVIKRTGKEHREIVAKTRESLREMQAWELFKGCADYLLNELGSSEKQVLAKLIG